MNNWTIIFERIKFVISKSNYMISNLSNISAILFEKLDNLNWVGFYILKENSLILGPFQGKDACTTIEIGKGVCGTAVQNNETILVPNVHEFPGHIACDSCSNSEIVIPIHFNDEIWGVLDIDSPILNRFNEEDKTNLEEIVKIIEENINNWKYI